MCLVRRSGSFSKHDRGSSGTYGMSVRPANLACRKVKRCRPFGELAVSVSSTTCFAVMEAVAAGGCNRNAIAISLPPVNATKRSTRPSVPSSLVAATEFGESRRKRSVRALPLRLPASRIATSWLSRRDSMRISIAPISAHGDPRTFELQARRSGQRWYSRAKRCPPPKGCAERVRHALVLPLC